MFLLPVPLSSVNVFVQILFWFYIKVGDGNNGIIYEAQCTMFGLIIQIVLSLADICIYIVYCLQISDIIIHVKGFNKRVNSAFDLLWRAMVKIALW